VAIEAAYRRGVNYIRVVAFEATYWQLGLSVLYNHSCCRGRSLVAGPVCCACARSADATRSCVLPVARLYAACMLRCIIGAAYHQSAACMPHMLRCVIEATYCLLVACM
jgi:hypothetical protein